MLETRGRQRKVNLKVAILTGSCAKYRLHEAGPIIDVLNVEGAVDAKVITQLERWWDKYQVSLHQLDDQVASAEAVMQGFLEELGYE